MSVQPPPAVVMSQYTPNSAGTVAGRIGYVPLGRVGSAAWSSRHETWRVQVCPSPLNPERQRQLAGTVFGLHSAFAPQLTPRHGFAMLPPEPPPAAPARPPAPPPATFPVPPAPPPPLPDVPPDV